VCSSDLTVIVATSAGGVRMSGVTPAPRE
jgi:hypothetical protein